MKPILLVLVGLIAIFAFAAALVFKVELVFWLCMLLIPVVTLQVALWSK